MEVREEHGLWVSVIGSTQGFGQRLDTEGEGEGGVKGTSDDMLLKGSTG